MLLSVFLIGSILCPVGLRAQKKVTLRILVLSKKDGTPKSGANVQLSNRKKLQFSNITNSDGLVEFSDIPATQYVLTASYVGYKTHTETIQLKEGINKIKRIILKEQVSELNELVIKSNREVTVGQTGLDKISALDISRIPTAGAGGDLAAYLRTVPGIISTGDRGGELYIRGGIPSQNKVLVDNLPIIKPFHISNIYSAFPQQSVQHVDLYTGGFGARYSGSTSAILDVNLRPGNFKRFNGKASASPYLASLQLEGPVNPGKTSLIVTGRTSLINNTSTTLYNRERDINFSDISARYSLQGDGIACSATGVYTFDRGKINPARNVGLSWRNVVLGARCLDYDTSIAHPLLITAGYSYYQNSEATDVRKERNSSISQFLLKFDQDAKIGSLPFDFGVKLHLRQYDATLAERFTPLDSYDEKRSVLNFYASTVWLPSSQFSFKPSLQTTIGLPHSPSIEPRLRIAYYPRGSHDIEFSFAGGRYYQTKSAISDVRDAGNIFKLWREKNDDEDLPSALHGLLGYKQRFGNHLTLNINGFIKRYLNLTVPQLTPVAKLTANTTQANGRAFGSDFQLAYQTVPFYFSLSYGYSNVQYTAAKGFLATRANNSPVFSYNPSFDQRHKVNATASYTTSFITANANWALGSGQPYTKVFGFDLAPDITKHSPLTTPGIARTLFSRPFGQRLPVYHRLDVSLKHTFMLSNAASINAYLGVLNLYNRQNIFYFDSNTLRRVNQTSVLPYLSIQANFR